ncbi:hypothetical protein Taro_042965 [Colocasia esculenta]|uniref:Uncharacterized protein n=1 Tax=Colocasia esculenta TaxID=4460 RepID=A0A843WQ71_COLES|nr:hypothetical protein [Colocasia esculenta]
MEGRRVVITFGHPSSQVRNRNTVNVTVELSSFGRPKEEKLKPHLCPLREAATTTWSKHSLGYSVMPRQFSSGINRGGMNNVYGNVDREMTI